MTDASFGASGKRIATLFDDALAQDAVLFVDEAEPLLSKRFVNPTRGAEIAINSMRSQLLIELERFDGVLVFSTNLLVAYDSAYISRLTPVHVPLPARAADGNLAHLPLSAARGIVDLNELAELPPEFSGRNIRHAYLSALGLTLKYGERLVTMDRLRAAIEMTSEAVRLERAQDKR